MLKELRKKKGLTQAKIAEMLGISQQAYQQIESKTNYPSIPTLIQICKILETTPNEILEFKQ